LTRLIILALNSGCKRIMNPVVFGSIRCVNARRLCDKQRQLEHGAREQTQQVCRSGGATNVLLLHKVYVGLARGPQAVRSIQAFIPSDGQITRVNGKQIQTKGCSAIPMTAWMSFVVVSDGRLPVSVCPALFRYARPWARNASTLEDR